MKCSAQRAEVRRLAAAATTSEPSFGGNAHPGIHLAPISVLCAGVKWRGRRSPGGHTYYVINPRPLPPARAALPARVGRAVLAPGFLVPAPHGHSLRTGLRVVPPPVALRPAQTSHLVRGTSYIV
ncbi:unnamed protein product, partial [Brenthis ino]